MSGTIAAGFFAGAVSAAAHVPGWKDILDLLLPFAGNPITPTTDNAISMLRKVISSSQAAAVS